MRPRRRTMPIVNLGDIVGYGASPNEVTARVRELGAAQRSRNRRSRQPRQGGRRTRQRRDVSIPWPDWPRCGIAHSSPSENLEWLRALPQGPVTLPGASQRPVRARRARRRRPLRGRDSRLAPVADRIRRDHHVFRPHPHSRSVSVLRNGFAETRASRIHQHRTERDLRVSELETGVSYMINPGSVGQPRDGDWRSGFALFDTERRVVTFCRVALRRCARRRRRFLPRISPPVWRRGWRRDGDADAAHSRKLSDRAHRRRRARQSRPGGLRRRHQRFQGK